MKRVASPRMSLTTDYCKMVLLYKKLETRVNDETSSALPELLRRGGACLVGQDVVRKN